MYIFIVIIHIIISIFLIAVILLQAGRGGGLADSLGGTQMQNLFGTQTKNVLTRLTTICAGLFIITCLSLAMISSQKSKSIVDKISVPQIPVSTANDVNAEQKEIPQAEGSDAAK